MFIIAHFIFFSSTKKTFPKFCSTLNNNDYFENRNPTVYRDPLKYQKQSSGTDH